MLRPSLILGGLLALSVTTGCYAHGTTSVSASYAYSTPDLVYVSPGVYVVADYNVPVFYSNGNYWMYRNGYWFRSRIYNRGFVRVYNPPVVVRRIRTPHRWVYVRPRGPVYRPTARGTVERRPYRRHHAPPPRYRRYP